MYVSKFQIARNAKNLLESGKITENEYAFIRKTMNTLLKENQEFSTPLYTSVRVEDNNGHDEIVFVRTNDGENAVVKFGNAMTDGKFKPVLLTGEITTITVDTDIYPGGLLFKDELDPLWSVLE